MKEGGDSQQSIVFFRRMADIAGHEGTVLQAPNLEETIQRFDRGEVQTLLVNSNLITGWCTRPVRPSSVEIAFVGAGWELHEKEQARARVRNKPA